MRPQQTMKTIICDIDGTLTDMWPIEKSVLLFMTDRKFANYLEQLKCSGISDLYKLFTKITRESIGKQKFFIIYNQAFEILLEENNLPKPKKLPLVKWIKLNSSKYIFVYATGGQRLETRYVLENLGLAPFFDFKNSIDKTSCRFAKRTGITFLKIKSKYSDCLLITDSLSDCEGTVIAKIPCVIIAHLQSKLLYFGWWTKSWC